MKYSKNTVRKILRPGIVILVFLISIFSSVSCGSQNIFQKHRDPVITNNISISSTIREQSKERPPYYSDGSIGCYCPQSSVFTTNSTTISNRGNNENCMLLKSMVAIMQNIDDACRNNNNTEKNGTVDAKNETDTKNTEPSEEDMTTDVDQQNTEDPGASTGITGQDIQAVNRDEFVNGLLYLINTSRNQNGLPSLDLNSSVCSVASLRSQDMIDRNYFSHTTPEGKNIFTILQECGIEYGSAGENIQYSYPPSNASAQQYFNIWMSSDIHRANILSSNYSQVGIGISYNDSRVVAVLVFIG